MKELRISEFADVVTGGTPSTSVKEYWENGNIPWLNSGELNKGYIYNAENFITEAGLKNSSTKMMPADTVLIALTGATCGLSAISKIEACANQSVTGILPSKNHVPEYLFYFLRTQRQRILDKAWGNAQPHISQAFVKDFKVPLPPLPDQLHIANLLSKAENLIAQRKESIRLLDDFLKSTFLEMFGDPVRNEKKLPLKNLEDIAAKEKNAIVDGPFGSSIKPEDYLDDGIPIIRINNIRDEGFYNNEFKFISEEKYNELIRSKVQPNDILIARVGNTIGKTCIFNQNFTALLSTTGVAKLTIDSSIINLNFLHQQLRLPQYVKYIWNQVQGAGQPYLNLSKIKGFKIIYPPLKLQTQFAQIVEKTEALKTQYQQSLQELENLYGSLSQKAFGGELNKKL